METTRTNPFAGVLAFIIVVLFIVGFAYGAYVAVQRGVLLLPARLTIDGQQPAQRPAAAPSVPSRPFTAPAPAAQPQVPAAPAQPAQQPQAAPQVEQPTGQDYQAPGEAAPAGAPMTEEYKSTIQEQNRTNANGELCLPRSGCTKPGSGGSLPWPSGRP